MNITAKLNCILMFHVHLYRNYKLTVSDEQQIQLGNSSCIIENK
jgi:hypothetical protein